MRKVLKCFETEYCGIAPAASQDNLDLGVAIVTLRLNRSKNSLTPVQLEFTRAALERLIEDAEHILKNAPIMNTPETLKESGKRIPPEHLPDLEVR